MAHLTGIELFETKRKLHKSHRIDNIAKYRPSSQITGRGGCRRSSMLFIGHLSLYILCYHIENSKEPSPTIGGCRGSMAIIYSSRELDRRVGLCSLKVPPRFRRSIELFIHPPPNPDHRLANPRGGRMSQVMSMYYIIYMIGIDLQVREIYKLHNLLPNHCYASY
ncbi:hypothetical protein EDB19DRAFT_664992 [Suillus lakei]|nr:hypothetical protein EDB19DRAFT_664992 [Suillus lakei]